MKSKRGGPAKPRGATKARSRYPRTDLAGIQTRSIAGRPSKIHLTHLGRPYEPGSRLSEFLADLPDILGARDLRAVIDAVVKAYRSGRPRVFMLGGHVIKCGLGPMLVQLMERGLITAIAGNGAMAIHDFELAMWGKTSEDVAESLADGAFGMTEETAVLMNEAIREGYEGDLGLGECLGERLLREAPNANLSVVATAVRLSLPVTVHVGIGTDTIHQHPSASGAALGETSYRDFLIFAKQVEDLGQDGVVLNLGSAVVLPEVFLKALSIARNLGRPAKGFVAGNFDQILHYRPRENVVRRPTLRGGRGYSFVGQHEVLLPLFFAGILEGLEKAE